MKIVGIGDLFIPAKYIEEGFKPLRDAGHEVVTLDWPLESFTQLQAINLKVEQNGCEAADAPECVYEACKDADVIITQFCPVNSKLVAACPKLKAVGVLRGGMENVCGDLLKEKGIALFNSPGRNAESVADFTVGMLICETRNIARGHYGLKTNQWIREYPNSGAIPDLNGRTIGLIGCGAIGQKVAHKLSGFDMRVLGFDPYANRETCEKLGIELVSLETLLAESDYVSLHARLTEQNKGMLSVKEFATMKQGAYLINTSRAGLIDEEALYEALRSGHLAGAALDVFEHEPPAADDPLTNLPNVTITPHMAGGSNDAFFNTPKLLRSRMQEWFATQH